MRFDCPHCYEKIYLTAQSKPVNSRPPRGGGPPTLTQTADLTLLGTRLRTLLQGAGLPLPAPEPYSHGCLELNSSQMYPRSLFYEAYYSWSLSCKEVPVNRSDLYRALAFAGFSQARDHSERFIDGVGLRGVLTDGLTEEQRLRSIASTEGYARRTKD